MAVDHDKFYEWCLTRFGEENIRIRNTAHGEEICTHSPWSEAMIGKTDTKHHLWMNVEGGKNSIEHGAYRCWLTDTMGSLVSLVAEFEGLPFEEAEELITGVASLRSLEKKVHEFFGHKETVEEMIGPLESAVPLDMVLPDYSYLIDTMKPESHHMKLRAKQYLRDRKLPTTDLYVCTDGDYGNRIVIPYYDKNENLIWYNARTMSPKKSVLRYMKPAEGDQDDVLFMTRWPRPGSKIYIMEGEFDAITLGLCGFVGCAIGGKYLSDSQLRMIKDYNFVLAFDADDAGLEATINVGNMLLERGVRNISFVRPPKVYKDWNKLLQQRNLQTVKAYVERFEKPYSPATGDLLMSNQLSL